MSTFDLAIAYRICPKLADAASALPFGDDKLRLSEACLRSFKDSLAGLRVKTWVLLDGCPPEYGRLFKKYFDEQNVVLFDLNRIGNERTFYKQIDILVAQRDAEVVYFAEDDYFYLPNQFPTMIDFLLKHQDVDFVSPYDHLDCYTLELHRQPSWLRLYGGRHWRTSASTCLTFLTKRETLEKTQAVFRKYKRRSFDCSVWLSLTKHRVFSPSFFCRQVFREPFFCKIIIKSWLYCWRQILFGKRRALWVPIPGIATHLEAHSLSPNIDWSAMMLQGMDTKIWTAS